MVNSWLQMAYRGVRIKKTVRGSSNAASLKGIRHQNHASLPKRAHCNLQTKNFSIHPFSEITRVIAGLELAMLLDGPQRNIIFLFNITTKSGHRQISTSGRARATHSRRVKALPITIAIFDYTQKREFNVR